MYSVLESLERCLQVKGIIIIIIISVCPVCGEYEIQHA